MQNFITLLISCSLGLAEVAIAQQPDQQASPAKKTKETATERGHGAGAGAGAKAGVKGGAEATHGAGANAVNAEKKANEPGVAKQHERNVRGGMKGEKTGAKTGAAASTASQQNASEQTGATPSPVGKQQAEQGKKGRHGRENANAKVSPSLATAAAATAAPSTAPSASATPATGATGAGAGNAAGVAAQQNVRGGNGAAAAKKPDPQQVQQIKAQHANFRAQPRPDRAPPVQFNASFRIEGSDRWQGQQYEAFRAYHPERHDRGWYHSRYQRVELIGGGYYYWNNGYWYPAWGYEPSAEYYAYDGPIYVGHRAEPPDKVIADVQAELQQMGYYQGEVDGLLGPLTRQALTAYQTDHGLTATAAIDEPTLDSLQLSS